MGLWTGHDEMDRRRPVDSPGRVLSSPSIIPTTSSDRGQPALARNREHGQADQQGAEQQARAGDNGVHHVWNPILVNPLGQGVVGGPDSRDIPTTAAKYARPKNAELDNFALSSTIIVKFERAKLIESTIVWIT